jgi:hypothetical protein
MCHSWRCPGCCALVALPAAAPSPADEQAEKRLDQLAQASCGCWVNALSKRGMDRLLEAIVSADDSFFCSSRVSVGRRS